MDNRYTVTFDMFIYADSDEDAVKQAEKIQEKYRRKYDNRCTIRGLEESPFGRLTTRPIEVF